VTNSLDSLDIILWQVPRSCWVLIAHLVNYCDSWHSGIASLAFSCTLWFNLATHEYKTLTNTPQPVSVLLCQTWSCNRDTHLITKTTSNAHNPSIWHCFACPHKNISTTTIKQFSLRIQVSHCFRLYQLPFTQEKNTNQMSLLLESILFAGCAWSR
jgi:hypothetical protein